MATGPILRDLLLCRSLPPVEARGGGWRPA